MKSLFKKIIVSFLILMLLPVTVKGEEYDYIGNSNEELYLKNGTMAIPYINVNDIQVYCAEYDKEVPKHIRYKKFEGGKEYDTTGILAIIYNGYPKNISNLQEKYSLSNEEALMYTQYALWNYIQGWDRNMIDNKYAAELLLKADNKDFHKEEFSINESKMFFKDIDGSFETDFVDSYGLKGKFVIKTDDTVKVYDEEGRERYNYNIGESFKLRKVSSQKENSTIVIDLESETLDMDLYEPIDSSYQDLITASTNVEEIEKRYVVTGEETKTRGIVQTADNELIYLLLIILGCGIYILLNMDFKKRYK